MPQRLPGITIRQAHVDEAGVVAAFAERTFRETFAGDNDPVDLDAYSASAFSVAAQRAHLQDGAIETLLAHDGDAVQVPDPAACAGGGKPRPDGRP
jgi:hypothetical protein